MKRKHGSIALALALVVAIFAACGGGGSAGDGGFNTGREITVVSREDGSGTRGAFIELMGVQETTADGSTVDRTTVEANIANGTSIVMGSVAGDNYAIGYISLGSLNDTVKALNLDGAAATPGNVLSGDYTLARPFIIATSGAQSELAADFIGFIMSAEGQAVVGGRGYIPVEASAPAFSGSLPSGTIVIAGSTSVAPVIEQLSDAYREINSGASIEIHVQGTTAGITATIEGISDIAMSSRPLNDNELAALDPVTIAVDGLAVIVNNNNPTADITSEQVRDIFIGEITRWNEIG
ncbi:MAG: substrate-binding domain-containing protein [Oscillospiraceae bacterium]|nr:substrate-binding domain-containing protein [Oscillospiraceae bacterium]